MALVIAPAAGMMSDKKQIVPAVLIQWQINPHAYAEQSFLSGGSETFAKFVAAVLAKNVAMRGRAEELFVSIA